MQQDSEMKQDAVGKYSYQFERYQWNAFESVKAFFRTGAEIVGFLVQLANYPYPVPKVSISDI